MAANNARFGIRVNLLVQPHMVAAVDNFQIVESVVQRIAVAMVDVFTRVQFPAQVLLHHPAVRPNLLSVPMNQSNSGVRT